ncbi:MAG TPA: hypothetical protein VK963_00075, partial [Candidatus Saccharimonadales bacterium]|nr:hypothetical protein [Candidatus Saccharimonadales bacterium]
TASGDSAINLYELAEDAPELRFIYETLAAEPAAYGALGIRNMGGGFNATTLALIEADRLTEYEELLSRRYREEFGRDYQFLSFVPAPAACILES